MAIYRKRVDFVRSVRQAKARVLVDPIRDLAGGFDYLIKIRVPDMEHYRRLLGERLAKLPGILHMHTYVAMEEVKSNFAFKF